jgi:hypothetical protein
MKKAYFSGNNNDGAEMVPFNDYYKPGSTELEDKQDSELMENHQRDGEDFEEFKSFSKKDRVKKLKELLKKKEKTNDIVKEPILEPTPFYNSMYGGGMQGFEGLNATPLEFYSGSVIDEGQSVQNPWENTYQSASVCERIKKRAVFFKGLLGNKTAYLEILRKTNAII